MSPTPRNSAGVAFAGPRARPAGGSQRRDPPRRPGQGEGRPRALRARPGGREGPSPLGGGAGGPPRVGRGASRSTAQRLLSSGPRRRARVGRRRGAAVVLPAPGAAGPREDVGPVSGPRRPRRREGPPPERQEDGPDTDARVPVARPVGDAHDEVVHPAAAAAAARPRPPRLALRTCRRGPSRTPSAPGSRPGTPPHPPPLPSSGARRRGATSGCGPRCTLSFVLATGRRAGRDVQKSQRVRPTRLGPHVQGREFTPEARSEQGSDP